MSATTLFLPALAPSVDATAPRPRFLALDRLTSRAAVSSRACAESAQWACEAFGVGRQQDWPVAPLSLHGLHGDPGGAYWLCATPVHLQVHQNLMLLLPPHQVALDADEAASLIETLESQFSADGLAFLAPEPNSWFLRCGSAPDLATTPVALAVGRHVDPLLPTGADRMRFHGLMNEVQMLLHEHPVNERREARGMPVVNSVWLWGGGVLPAAAQSPWPAVASSRALELGLARLAGIPAAPLDRQGDSVDGLQVLPEGLTLDAIERDWAAPLLAQLASGTLDRLEIVTLDAGQAHGWTLGRKDLWKFWRRTPGFDRLPGQQPQ